ncbi:hypothetical protein [Burkholderia cenocepacia]|uniref:hypothetical protein n=1 Tax=Burkholderia cenocepacia TaxID=95486 RepID=UPI003EE13BFA
MVQKTPGNWDPIQTFTGQELCSSLAVYAFFLVSGIFITRSFDQNRNPFRFVIARLLRIWPGLVACAGVTAFAIGPMMSTLSFTDYFSSPPDLLMAYHCRWNIFRNPTISTRAL